MLSSLLRPRRQPGFGAGLARYDGDYKRFPPVTWSWTSTALADAGQDSNNENKRWTQETCACVLVVGMRTAGETTCRNMLLSCTNLKRAGS